MKVSVVTTLYNYGRYITECIQSFIEQDFPHDDCEMVIVDDASTDNGPKLVQYHADSWHNIKYIRFDKNRGYSAAKNAGIKYAQGEYLVMLDADDRLTKGGISARYDKIVEGYDLVHGPALDLRGGKLKRSKLWKQWMNSKKDASCYKLIHAQGVMVRRDVHKRVGLYDEEMRCKSDREMWARVMNHGLKIGWVDEDVSIYRIHDKQMHKSKEKLKRNQALQKDALQRIKRRKNDLSDVEMLT